jgi:hypothetical protein
MRFGTWEVRSLYRSGSLIRVARELARYKLDLLGIEEVRWDKGEIYYFLWKRKRKSSTVQAQYVPINLLINYGLLGPRNIW